MIPSERRRAFAPLGSKVAFAARYGVLLSALLLASQPSCAQEQSTAADKTPAATSPSPAGSTAPQAPQSEVLLRGNVGTVRLTSPTELLSAFGLVIADGDREEATGREEVAARRSTVRKRKGTVEAAGEDEYLVRLEFAETDLRPGTKLLVVATDADGKSVPGQVLWLKPPAQREPAALSCRPQRNVKRLNEVAALNEKQLRELVALRKRRRDLLQDLLKEIQLPALFARLNEAEERFGIAWEEPISERTPYPELVQRLGAIDAFQRAAAQ